MKIKMKWAAVNAILMETVTEEVTTEAITVEEKTERKAIKVAKSIAEGRGQALLHVKSVSIEEREVDIPVGYLLAYNPPPSTEDNQLGIVGTEENQPPVEDPDEN